jgi:hypothetical protein
MFGVCLVNVKMVLLLVWLVCYKKVHLASEALVTLLTHKLW